MYQSPYLTFQYANVRHSQELGVRNGRFTAFVRRAGASDFLNCDAPIGALLSILFDQSLDAPGLTRPGCVTGATMMSWVCKWRSPLFLDFFLFACFEAPVDVAVVVVCRSLTPAKCFFERSEWRMTNDGDPGVGLWVGG